ncbi:MAG: hypothetical protein KY447_07210 [Actinobacteria bacterium]|nr:hypothetical protein [Actinomycetota bacterium]
MRTGRPLRSTRLLGVVVAAGCVAAIVVAGVATFDGDAGTKDGQRSRLVAPDDNKNRPDEEFVWQTPVTAGGPETPVQHETDQAFLDAMARQPGMASAVALPVPPPEISGGWPRLPVESVPEAWAQQFVKGLLDIDYAEMSREALGPWLQAHAAPALVPGIPESVADKMLYTSLIATEVFGGQPTPIPPAEVWKADAQAGTRQWVSDLRVQVNPQWARLVATGWQPPDGRMTTLDVSGLLHIQRGDAASREHFALKLLVGSARWRKGYGTVSVFDWRLGAR